MAQLKVRKWAVEDCVFDDIEVRNVADDGEGARIEIEQSEDIIWIALGDVPALIQSLKNATEAA